MSVPYPLYNPTMEHESCGVGAVIDLVGTPSHRTVCDALTIVERLAHRAGHDALGTTGDGVGILPSCRTVCLKRGQSRMG